MGLLIAMVFIGVVALAIGIAGGIHAARTQQWLLSAVGTVGIYYLLIGIPGAWMLMESEGDRLQAFVEAFLALARTLLLLGLVPLLITFALAAMAAR